MKQNLESKFPVAGARVVALVDSRPARLTPFVGYPQRSIGRLKSSTAQRSSTLVSRKHMKGNRTTKKNVSSYLYTGRR